MYAPPMTTKHGISFFVFMITVHGSYHLLKHHCQFYWGCIPAVHQISPADSKWTHGFHRQPLALWCGLARYVEYLEIKCLSPTVYFVFHPLYWLVSESHLKKKIIINLWKWVYVSYTMSYLIQDTVHAHHYIYMCRKLIYLIHLTSPTDSTILILVVLPCNFSPHRPSNRVTYTAAFISSTHPRLLPAFSCSSKRFAWRTISVR